MRHRKYYSSILIKRYDVIFPQWLLRFGTKFSRLMQNKMQITVKWSISKPVVEFQYGGRLFFKNGSSYISAINWDMSTKFSLLIDCDLLKAMTSTNRPTTSGFVFVDVLAFRMSKSINKPNFVEINGQHNINLWLRYNDFWFGKTDVHHIGILLPVPILTIFP